MNVTIIAYGKNTDQTLFGQTYTFFTVQATRPSFQGRQCATAKFHPRQIIQKEIYRKVPVIQVKAQTSTPFQQQLLLQPVKEKKTSVFSNKNHRLVIKFTYHWT